MRNRIISTAFTYLLRLAGLDDVFVEHGETACIMSVEVATPLYECVIPGFQCTHRHDVHPVRWPPDKPA
jgi:hypothetical protein